MAASSNYRDVMRYLAKIDPALKKTTTKRMRALSVEVVAEARSAAAWSETIPSAIRPMATAAGVGVRVSGKVPIAVLNEQVAWRHPLFGDRANWFDQLGHPAVRPAVEKNRVRLGAIGEEILADALHEAKT